VRPRKRVPGALVSLDTFYIGKLKGVGRLWQITACDAASCYGVGWLLPALTAEATAAFLTRILHPLYRRAGWPLEHVLTDGGSEFRTAFDEACRALGIRHTRTRHAWTNGLVERLQGTILHEDWRILFRRRYFTSHAAMQRTLDAFMQFYNEQRPHQGYRLRGRTAADLFWRVAAVAAGESHGRRNCQHCYGSGHCSQAQCAESVPTADALRQTAR
jgi:transposase InsO family protein